MGIFLVKCDIALSQTKVLPDKYNWSQPDSKTAKIKDQANSPKSSN